jgi:hypothetical protein
MPSRPPDCDLHPYFRDPDKARAILDACIADCRRQGRSPVRVVHGKGKGDFRKMIHSHLEKHADVAGFVECDPLHGGSGATWVHIAGIPDEEPATASGTSESRGRVAPALFRWTAYLVTLAAWFAIFPDWVLRIVIIIFIVWFEYRITHRKGPD